MVASMGSTAGERRKPKGMNRAALQTLRASLAKKQFRKAQEILKKRMKDGAGEPELAQIFQEIEGCIRNDVGAISELLLHPITENMNDCHAKFNKKPILVKAVIDLWIALSLGNRSTVAFLSMQGGLQAAINALAEPATCTPAVTESCFELIARLCGSEEIADSLLAEDDKVAHIEAAARQHWKHPAVVVTGLGLFATLSLNASFDVISKTSIELSMSVILNRKSNSQDLAHACGVLSVTVTAIGAESFANQVDHVADKIADAIKGKKLDVVLISQIAWALQVFVQNRLVPVNWSRWTQVRKRLVGMDAVPSAVSVLDETFNPDSDDDFVLLGQKPSEDISPKSHAEQEMSEHSHMSSEMLSYLSKSDSEDARETESKTKTKDVGEQLQPILGGTDNSRKEFDTSHDSSVRKRRRSCPRKFDPNFDWESTRTARRILPVPLEDAIRKRKAPVNNHILTPSVVIEIDS